MKYSKNDIRELMSRKSIGLLEASKILNKQSLLIRVEEAKTLEDLKAVIKDLVEKAL